MPELVPLISDPHFDFLISLSGSVYLIEIRWNDRAQVWTMDLYTDQGEAIFLGQPMLIGAAIGERSANKNAPGIFTVTDTSGKGLDAKADDLGTRVVCHYWPKA